MSCAGPEVLFGLNQRPERVLIPPFHSFKKGHTSDIRPATLSSWLKQTILLCYKQADQQALDLVQVKAHDIRAFAASKAFYSGVSVDQIMQACHWKAHNTFTNFYLKDLTWSDNDNNMYLGPVVAAQQVLDPSPQTRYPRKKKKWGIEYNFNDKLSKMKRHLDLWKMRKLSIFGMVFIVKSLGVSKFNFWQQLCIYQLKL